MIDWQDVSENDHILIHHNDVEGVTNNPVEEVCVIATTLNKDFARVSKPNNVKNWWWIETKQYVLKEILPPMLNK